MQKTFLFILLMAIVRPAFAQVLYQSTTEIGEKNYVPSANLKEKVAKLAKDHVWGGATPEDKDFYQLKNGNISYFQYVEYAHYRLIYDSKLDWLETQEYRHSDVQQEDEYHQLMPKMRKQIATKKYKVDEGENYIKVTNAKGHWYELKASKGKDIKTFILDKNLKIVKMQ
jgi:nitrogen fixation protein